MGGLILTARKNRIVPRALCDSRALAPNKVVSPEGVSGERGGDSQRPTSCQLLSLSLSLSFFLSFPPSPSVHKGGREIKKNYVLISQTRFSVFFALSKSTDRLANGSFFR